MFTAATPPLHHRYTIAGYTPLYPVYNSAPRWVKCSFICIFIPLELLFMYAFIVELFVLELFVRELWGIRV